MKTLSIDPGNEKTAYSLLDEEYKLLDFGIKPNNEMLSIIKNYANSHTDFVIEMVASYGMAVGKEVFETVFWIGRMFQYAEGYNSVNRIYRKDVKMNLCHTMKAKDGNVRQALIDRFGEVGTKKNQGHFYGVSKDVWAAIAVGVTFIDMKVGEGHCT